MATQRTASELWKPSAGRAQRAVLTLYTRWLAEQRDLRFSGYDALLHACPPSSMVCIWPGAANPGDPVIEQSAFADLPL